MARQGCAGGADTPAVLGDCVSAAGWAAGLGSARDPDAQLSYGDQLSSAGRKPDSTAVWPASWRWAWRPIPALPLPAGDKALDGYSKKKYVCKLLFIFLLGHDIDFGHMEAVNLLSSNRYTEKQIVSVQRGTASPWGPWYLALALHLRLSGDFPRFKWELVVGHHVLGSHPRGRVGTLPPLSELVVTGKGTPPHPHCQRLLSSSSRL